MKGILCGGPADGQEVDLVMLTPAIPQFGVKVIVNGEEQHYSRFAFGGKDDQGRVMFAHWRKTEPVAEEPV